MMANKPEGVSRVQFAFQPGGPYPSHCGYCHGETDSFMADGVWAEDMTVHDFQDLVDRGCQRSGKFVYLPCNKATCCPQYVMRLDSTTFRISKQQRRVIRRFAEYLKTGQVGGMPPPPSNEDNTHGTTPTIPIEDGASPPQPSTDIQISTESCETPTEKPKPKKLFKPGKGKNPNLPECRKAKLIRKEKKDKRKQQLMAVDGKEPNTGGKSDLPSSSSVAMETTQVPQKTPSDMKLELQLPDSSECKHKFSVKLVCVNPTSKEYDETFDQSYKVFRKFQMGIHKEPEDKCQEHHFKQFCSESPLMLSESPIPGVPYGSYHQQYWIDDTLVMVGVLDFLPQGVLCNYLYYDPQYRFLAPGVFSALYEIGQTQEYSKTNPLMKYYFMGYYVHDCPKMNYKRFYDSSYILCPETYEYVPLELGRTKLDQSKYCRLADTQTNITSPAAIDIDDQDNEEIDEELPQECHQVLVFNNPYNVIMKYKDYRIQRGSRHHDQLIELYTRMVGPELAHRMVLYFYGLVPMS